MADGGHYLEKNKDKIRELPVLRCVEYCGCQGIGRVGTIPFLMERYLFCTKVTTIQIPPTMGDWLHLIWIR